MDALEERDGRSVFRRTKRNRILRRWGGWAAQGLSAVCMGVISWADQSCAGKGSGSLSRNLAAAQPEGCRAVLLISGGNGDPTCLGLILPEPDRPAGWLEVKEMAPVPDPAQRSCLPSTTTAMAVTSPHGDQQRWNDGGGNAPSSSALPPRRPAISCAIETDAHRQGRPWWRARGDRP